MTRFDHIDRIAAKAVDATFGEPFAFTPRETIANSRPRRDESRDFVEGRGVFEMKTVELGPNAYEVRSLPPGKAPTLSVDAELFGSEPPREGDLVTRPARNKRYEVVLVERDRTRFFLVLVAAGR